jgi:hypothetical protein
MRLLVHTERTCRYSRTLSLVFSFLWMTPCSPSGSSINKHLLHRKSVS